MQKLIISSVICSQVEDFDGAMLDVAWKNLESENNRFKDIDAKAIGVITITGILMTFLVKPTNTTSSKISLIIFTLTAISFFFTILLSVSVIRTRKASVLSTRFLINDLVNEKPERQIRGIIGTIAESESNIQAVCAIKAKELTRAVFALGFSIILLISYSLSTIPFSTILY